jgi:hypothetical protein
MFIFFLFLGAGGYFKIFAYHFLPYLGYVRLNGEFAYFTYLILILTSVYGLHKMSLKTNIGGKKSFKLLQYVFGISSLIFLGIILITRDSILFNDDIYSPKDLKNILNSLSFWDLCFIGSVIQWGSAFVLKQYSPNQRPFFWVAALNLIITSWGCLPFTGLGEKSRNEVQAILDTVPKGINTPPQKAVKENVYIDSRHDRVIGSSAFFSKQIGYPTIAPYPVILKSTSLYFSNDSLVRFINAQSYLFLSTDTTIQSRTTFDRSTIKVLLFTPTKTRLAVKNVGFKYLTFLQNNYPRWKVFLDNKPVKHFTSFSSFIGIPISNGFHEVEFRFDSKSLQVMLWVNLSIICLGLGILSQKKIADRTLFT